MSLWAFSVFMVRSYFIDLLSTAETSNDDSFQPEFCLLVVLVGFEMHWVGNG